MKYDQNLPHGVFFDMFAVIEIEQPNYDEIIGVKCVHTSDTKKEAEEFIQKIRDNFRATIQQRLDYIDSFVDGLVVPEENYEEWVKQFKNFNQSGPKVQQKNFKKKFKEYLKTRHIDGIVPEYNPPRIINGFDIYVVEIPKEKSCSL